MNSFFKTTILLTGGLLMLSGCVSDEGVVAPGGGKTVRMTAEFTRPEAGNPTRTDFTETNDGNLDCVWSVGDRLLVTLPGGQKVGELTLLPEYAGKSNGKFDGTLTGLSDGDINLKFFYLGRNSGRTAVNGNVVYDISTQDGTMSSFGVNDCLSADCKVSIENGSAYTENIPLWRYVAYGRFHLSMPDGVDAKGAVVTVSGANMASQGTYSLSGSYFALTEGDVNVTVGEGNEFYMTLIPCAAIEPEFYVTVGDKQYAGKLPARDWETNEYVREETAGTFSGIDIDMQEVGGNPGGDPGDGDAIGPVYTNTDGRKFRLTRSNLIYTIADNSWHLAAEPYLYVRQRGYKYGNSNNYNPVFKEVDLFGWGATGLYDPELGQAQHPLYRGENSNDGGNQHYSGSHFPTVTTAYNSCSPGEYFEKGLQAHPNFDWGTAYAQSIGSSETYFTLSSKEWKIVSDQSFMVIGTITDMIAIDNKSKEKQTGLFIIPETDTEAVKALLKRVCDDPVIGSNFCDLVIDGMNSSLTKIDPNALKVKLADMPKLEEAGVVFLPSVGHGAISSVGDWDGCYWTSTGSQTYNAYYFAFVHNSTSKKFKIDSATRSMGYAVRLAKEVKE